MLNFVDVVVVKRFIGFVNYFSKFLFKYSKVFESFRKFTMKDIECYWIYDQDEVFYRLKLLVIEVLVLKYFEFVKEFILQSDVFDIGLGVVIILNGQLIVFISIVFFDVEIRYVQIEKGLLVIVFGFIIRLVRLVRRVWYLKDFV